MATLPTATNPRLKKYGMLTSTSYAGASYDASSRSSVELGGWNPTLRSPDAALLPERKQLDARTRDLERNSGWAYAGVTRKLDNTLGANVRMQLQPDYAALGITKEEARTFSKQVEGEWRLYTRDMGRRCDAGKRLTFGGMARVLLWHWTVDGRCLAVPVNLPKRGARYATAFMLIDPVRLTNPRGQPNTWQMRDGIEIDQYNAPIAYNIRNQHPGDYLLTDPTNSYSWTRIPAETSWGRRRVVHAFDQRQAEQTNGISALIVAMKRLKMIETHADLRIQKAAIEATFAAFIKSSLPSEVLFKGLTEAPTGYQGDVDDLALYTDFVADYHEKNQYKLNGARVGQLLPNESFEVVKSEGPGQDYEVAERAWLRYFCSIIDISYEQLSGDWSGVNYSTARALLSQVWKATQRLLDTFGDAVLTPMFLLWLEEAVMTGRVKLPAGAPDFYEATAAWCNPIWTGPGAGYLDPKKERDAEVVGRNGGNLTLKDMLAEEGKDWEDHIDQLALEQDALKAAKLPIPQPSSVDGRQIIEPTDAIAEAEVGTQGLGK